MLFCTRYVANRIQRFQLVSFHRRRCVTSTPQLVFTSLLRAISGASNPSGKGSRSGFPPDGYGDKSSCNFVVPSRIARLPQVLQTCELLLHQRTIGSPSPSRMSLTSSIEYNSTLPTVACQPHQRTFLRQT